MSHRERAGLSIAVAAALVWLGLPAGPLSIASAQPTPEEQDRPRLDEFGTIPEDAVDKDLSLPDPRLDGRWPGPLPGDPIPPPTLAPEESEVDPFEAEEPARPPSRLIPRDRPSAEAEDEQDPVERPWSPPRAPDGSIDEGNLDSQPDPFEEDDQGTDGYDSDGYDSDGRGSDRYDSEGEEPSMYGDLRESEESPSPLDEGEDLYGGDDDFYDSGMGEPGEW